MKSSLYSESGSAFNHEIFNDFTERFERKDEDIELVKKNEDEQKKDNDERDGGEGERIDQMPFKSGRIPALDLRHKPTFDDNTLSFINLSRRKKRFSFPSIIYNFLFKY
jgi:hypothetical protein